MGEVKRLMEEYRRQNNKDSQELVKEATNGLKEAGKDEASAKRQGVEFNPDKAIKIMRDDLANPSSWC